MKVELARHYSYRDAIVTSIPSIVMMLVGSIYSIVDGLFVSNFAGTTPFAAINLIWPAIMVFGALGLMMGTGGCALVAKTIGEGHRDEANRIFSMLVRVTVIGGIGISLVFLLLLRPVAVMLGAEGELLSDCLIYGSILTVCLPAFLLQMLFQPFFMTAERPTLGTKMSVACGLTNILLDFIFIVIFNWGVAGAALATVMAQIVGGFYPYYYFHSHRNKSSLRLVHIDSIDWHAIKQSCLNGSSEYMGNIALSIVSICYNLQLIHYLGENGVAAYGILMYAAYVYAAVFIGYNISIAPVISYHYGAGHKRELHSLLVKSLVIIGTLGTVMTIFAELTGRYTSAIFVSYDEQLLQLTIRAYAIYMVSFMLFGINLFVSAFFTALNNGVVSAAVAFTRTLIFEIGAVFILPLLIGIDGIWWSVDLADLLAFIMSIIILKAFRKKYGY